MTRKCKCSGHCVPTTPVDDVSRRDFIKLVGAGAGAVAAAPFGAAAAPFGAAAEAAKAEEFERWKKALREPDSPRLYRSDLHRDARMHLGGIGTGNLEIGVDGRLTTWQLFNTLRDGHVPMYFAVKAEKTVKLLQTQGGPELSRVAKIEMKAEYPTARLRFLDPDLPVELSLEAFSPFVPLDTRASSMPLAVFIFRAKNPSDRAIRVSLAALLANPVGYDAAGSLEGIEHPALGGNFNEPWREAGGTGLLLRAVEGKVPSIDRPVRVIAGANLRGLLAAPYDRPETLKVEAPDRFPALSSDEALTANTVLWLEDLALDLPRAILAEGRRAAEAGATLLLAGLDSPLLAAYGVASGGKPPVEGGGRPDLLFEDFEHGYKEWKVEGRAFGEKPAGGTLPSQQQVSAFVGKGLVNTFLGGDDPKGRLTSPVFRIERKFLRFLVGGGSHPTTQIRLLLDGKVVRSTSGRDEERLLPVAWDVAEFEGREARVEIVDEQSGPWGHVNVDQIEMSDRPNDMALISLLDEILPARYSRLARIAGTTRLRADDLALKPGARRLELEGALEAFEMPLGKGKVVLALGRVLEPAAAETPAARSRAYGLLASLVGAKYEGSEGQPSRAPGFGALALGTLAKEATLLASVKDPLAAWAAFAANGRFDPADAAKAGEPSPAGTSIYGGVAVEVTVPPGGEAEIPFFLAWRYPNKYNSANEWMGCHYAVEWPDVRDVAREFAVSSQSLRARTESFRECFFSSSLPWYLLDCVSSQAAIIRHIGVVFRIANGDPYGWEGSNGCCQPTCTHVWGYEQSLSRLFPDLERGMRRIDFTHQQREDGGVNNRTHVPSPPRPTGEFPFADGHSSCILKAWREALNQHDRGWLDEYWPRIKKAVEYLIARDAAGAGGEPAGILRDDQWNTYDEALHGVTTFIGTYYLAALRAGEEWALRVGDRDSAARFHSVFEKGRAKLQELCWNGEYFEQKLPGYETMPGEVGPGCMSDQLIGQWWAYQLGLGYLLPKEKVVSSLRAVFKYNWKPDLTGWRHSPRAFAGAGDKGLIICTWPRGGRPGHVMLYSDEVWTGIEYQVAAHMIEEGLVDEGLAIVKGARDRYDGVPRPPIPRNPFNEIECGGHYARAMSSWSLLLALSGWECDGPARSVRFTPKWSQGAFRSFFCAPTAWGQALEERKEGAQEVSIRVVEGTLECDSLILRRLDPAARKVEARILSQAGEAGAASVARELALSIGDAQADERIALRFGATVRLGSGDTLVVRLS